MKFIKYFDIFAIDLPLPFKKNKKYQTYLGAISTICCIILIFLSFIYFSQDIIHKNNPKVISLEENVRFNSNERLNFNQNNLFFAFSLYSEYTLSNIRNESIFSVSANFYKKNLSVSEYDSKRKLTIIPCKENDLPKNKIVNEFFKPKLDFLYCISLKDYTELFLSGTWEDDNYEYLQIIYKKCVQNENLTCVNESYSKNILRSIWIEIFLIDLSIDLSNYESPNQLKTKMYSYFVSEGESKNIIFNYKIVNIETDNGILFENKYSKKFWKLSSIYDETHQINSNYFGQILFLCSKEKLIYKRTYDKLPKIIAEVGGIIQIFIIIFRVLFKNIFKLMLYREIINEYYFYEKIKKKQKKNKNNEKIENIEEKSNSKKLSSIGNINIIKRCSVSLINSMKPRVKKLKTSFCELFLFFVFKSKKKKEKKIMIKNAIDDFEEKMQLDYNLMKFKEIEIIKNLIFDKNQINFLDLIPKCIVFNSKIQNIKNFKNNNIRKCIKNIIDKQEKNEIDHKIIKYFDLLNIN